MKVKFRSLEENFNEKRDGENERIERLREFGNAEFSLNINDHYILQRQIFQFHSIV